MAPPLSLEEAQARLLALAAPLAVEELAITEALGRYLAAPLLARRTQPAADLSAMDGYALRAADLPGPWQVVGESAAGHPFAGLVGSGQAVRISTGAMMPEGADAVVLQEDCARDGECLSLTGDGPQPPGKHIRRRGFDFQAGTPLLPVGTRIGPAQLALALSAGLSHLPVRRAPRVVVIDSGDELAPAGADCPPHQIPASNGAMLVAMASSLPCMVSRIGPVADDLSALAAALAACDEADVIVTSGGASVGDHDLVRPALEAWGAEIDFWKIAIKPGKPLLVARRGRQIVIGLPGNPVSSFVTAHLFLLPLLRALLGDAAPLPGKMQAVLAAALPANGSRREFRRGLWNGIEVRGTDQQDSSALAALAASNCLIDRPAEAPAAQAGEMMAIYPFDLVATP